MTYPWHIFIIVNEMSTIKSKMKIDIIKRALQEHRVMRTCEITDMGVSREYLCKLSIRGIIERVGHGLYRLPDSELTVNHSIVEASKRVSSGVICLLSALRFHNVTTQAPFEVWMALNRRIWHPKITDFPLRFFSFTGAALTEGIEEYIIEGVPVHIYSLEKTIADCFKYRNKIGIDVAVEAFREAIHAKRIIIDTLWKYAKIDGVSNVMRPYLESII